LISRATREGGNESPDAHWAIAASLGGVAVTFAQQPAKIYRIGWLSGDSDANTTLGAAFIAGMREAGWIEGQNFTIETVLSEHRNERFPALAAELVQRKVDLIVATG
jgi:putative ABC transport system substrate-binding protein